MSEERKGIRRLGRRLLREERGDLGITAAILLWTAVTVIMAGTVYKGVQVVKGNMEKRSARAAEALEGAVGIVPMPKPPEPKKEEEPAPKPKVRVVEEEVHRPAPQPQVQAPQPQEQVIVLSGSSGGGESNPGHTNTGTETDCAVASHPHYNASSDMGMEEPPEDPETNYPPECGDGS